jgi:hypothetical protein
MSAKRHRWPSRPTSKVRVVGSYGVSGYQDAPLKRSETQLFRASCPEALCATDVMGWGYEGGISYPDRARRRRPSYSRRICLMRTIAPSTACSGLMPSVTTRWTAVGPDVTLDPPAYVVDCRTPPNTGRCADGSGTASPRPCGAGRWD